MAMKFLLTELFKKFTCGGIGLTTNSVRCKTVKKFHKILAKQTITVSFQARVIFAEAT